MLLKLCAGLTWKVDGCRDFDKGIGLISRLDFIVLDSTFYLGVYTLVVFSLTLSSSSSLLEMFAILKILIGILLIEKT